ncbi:MAG: hypothetical protein A3E25_13490 [Burkholderiales bacterium RIFCSPHIGHO2_12_FULL_69_20]|nr:MAG: hypothetical protein A3E25_13490 [Burkholderiales bacterium RIFCSPHIGHO2_12_FULL_69_20]
MHTLYNSDSFVVVSFEVPGTDGEGPASLSRGGYEIVDKFARKEIFIEGALAESFQQGVQALVAQRPGSDAEALHEVLDDYIAGFAELAQQPVVLH